MMNTEKNAINEGNDSCAKIARGAKKHVRFS